VRKFHIDLEVIAPDDWEPRVCNWHDGVRAAGAIAGKLLGHSSHLFDGAPQVIAPGGIDSASYGELGGE
jgi:hypothetical protein